MIDDFLKRDVADTLSELGSTIEEFLGDFIDGRTEYIVERMASDLFFYVEVDETNKVKFNLLIPDKDEDGMDKLVGTKELKFKKVLIDHMDRFPEDAEVIIKHLKDIIKTQEQR